MIKDPKFKFGNHLRILKQKHFCKTYTPNWSEEFFVIIGVKNTMCY